MFTVDGITWPYPCSVERASEIKLSEISGMLMDGSAFNDVLGTYMQYKLKLAIPLTDRDAGNQIYELLTQPVDGHTFVFPYNSSTVTITGLVSGPVNDVFVRLSNGGKYWKGLQFTVKSNAPTKQMSLSQVLTRGRAPLPDVASPSVGDTYTWDGTAWGPAPEYEDADDIAY